MSEWSLGQWIVYVMNFQKIHGLYSDEGHKVKKWSGRVGLVGLCRSVDQWIVGVMSFQKIYGLYSLKHHVVEVS